MKVLKLATIAAVAVTSSAAMANVVTDTAGSIIGGTKTLFKTAANPAAVSLEVGTLGYGANLAWGVNEKTELQIGWAGGDIAEAINDNFDANGVNYQVETDFSNPYIGVQMRPASNWLTVGAGIIVPDNEIKVKANPVGSDSDAYYRIQGNDYKVSDVGALQGTLEHRNTLAPYLTLGFRPNINNRWGVFGEVGAAYLGKSDAKITSTAGRQDVADLAADDINSKDRYDWLPIVKVGATLRF